MKLGSVTVSALKVGAVNASKAYLGSTLVWEASGGGGGGVSIVGETHQYLSNSATVDVVFPEGVQDGDQLLVIEHTAGTTNGIHLSAPAGWTRESPANWGSNAWRATLLHRVFQAGDGAGQQFTASSSTARVVFCVAVRGVTYGSFASAGQNLTSGTQYEAPSLAPAAPSVLLGFFSVRKNASTGVALSVPSGMTSMTHVDGSLYKSLLAWEEVAAGATGTRTSSHSPDTGAGGALAIALTKS